MKISQADILIIAGYTDCGPEHWQSRWLDKMRTARKVEQAEWSKPVRDDWVASVRTAIETSTRPVVLVAHSLGVAAAVHAALSSDTVSARIAGGFFVAPPEVDNPAIRPRHLQSFGPYPTGPLPFPSVTVASRNDPFSRFERASDIAADWGSFLVDAGEAGHINEQSGHGPWPEGLMVFAEMMRRL